MAQSPEYPDLVWMPPKSWTDANRSSVQLLVIHTTEGNANNQAAENGAGYSQRRTDGTSAHYYIDGNSIVHCVRTADIAHTARGEGNRRGIHYEFCTKAATSKAGWANEYHEDMLKLAAKQIARDAKKWNIPIRHLTVEQVKDGEKGLCGHVDITRAFKQSTHTDPGVNFPWSRLLELIRLEMDDSPVDTNCPAKKPLDSN